MKHRILLDIVTTLAILAGTGRAMGPGDHSGTPHGPVMEKASFQRDMRMLWEDHVTWTRLYIVSALADLPDKDAAAARLLRNQSDIGNAIIPIYGPAAGEKLTGLLKEHILVAVDLIAGVKAGDTARSSRAGALWDSNAVAIAAFLSGANPEHWPAEEMRSMMREHLSATREEVTARLRHDWEGDVRSYDNVHGQILHMADMLSSGIISQFPAKFR